jgi:phosphatidylglycerophosphatase A
MKTRILFFLATGGGIGLIPGAPGTYAAAATTVIYYLVYRIQFRIRPELHISAICLITAIGIFAAAEASRRLGKEDPSPVVIDEVAGQLVALLILPVNLPNLAAAFFLFRLFDIWKPFPIRRLEPLPNGVGIMADDLLAGIYANILLQAVNRLLYA